MLSSSCFMPTSLMPQSLPPTVPSIASYFGDSIVVMCMRAGLYQTKNGLLVFLGSLRSRKSITWVESSSSIVLDRSRVSGPSSLHSWFGNVPSDDLHEITGRGGVMHRTPLLGSTSPGTGGSPLTGVLAQGGTMACWVGLELMSGKLTCCIASR